MAEALKGSRELQARLAAISDTRKMLGIIGLQAVAEAKAIVPRRTGNLGRTIRLGTLTTEYVEVRAGGQLRVGYARHVEFGTKARVIRPRKARALAWGGPRTLAGRLRTGAKPEFFARSVKHPGSKAKPYLVPGIKLAVRKAGFDVQVRDAWNRAA